MDVRAKLTYHVRDGSHHYMYLYKPEGMRDEDQFGGTKKEKEVLIVDGRRATPTLDTSAFQLFRHVTSLSTRDFYDHEKVKEKYYAEMAEFLKKKLGAEHVKIIQHNVRNPDKHHKNAQSKDVQGYALAIHTDFDGPSTVSSFAHYSRDVPSRYARGRYLFVNAWRNIDEAPVESRPLAVLDQRSLGKDDVITADFYADESGKKFTLHNCRLDESNSHAHKWHYFPAMERDEVLVFKQWDTDVTRQGRYCFHSSFEDPNSPVDARTRQSCEVRAIAYFPDHSPNTIPTAKVWIMWTAMGMMGLGKVGLAAVVAVGVAVVAGGWLG